MGVCQIIYSDNDDSVDESVLSATIDRCWLMSTWELGPEYGDRGRFANIYLENVTASYAYWQGIDAIPKWGWYNNVDPYLDFPFRDKLEQESYCCATWGYWPWPNHYANVSIGFA